jgi:hypothetical protein
VGAELVPVENLAEVEALDPAAREIAVTQMLSEARSWLAHAVESTGPTEIAQFKAMVATVAETTKQLNLSKAIQLDALEMVRRAERGLGQAIRRGQETGEVATNHEIRSYAGRVSQASQHNGDTAELVRKPSPSDFSKELHSTGSTAGIYEFTDGVSDEQFEEAITQAKEEGNLSRANVVRKATGKTLVSDRPEVLRGTRRLDSNRIVEQTVRGAEPVGELLDLVDFSALDPTHLEEWVSSLSGSIKRLRRLQSDLEKELSRV